MAYQAWLADALAKDGKEIRELAKRLRVHPTAIYRMIQGNRRIHVDEWPAIAKYLDCQGMVEVERHRLDGVEVRIVAVIVAHGP